MAHTKKHGPAPVPPANQPAAGPPQDTLPGDEQQPQRSTKEAASEEQDPKRRLGNYQGTGEAAFVQPGGKNDANR